MNRIKRSWRALPRGAKVTLAFFAAKAASAGAQYLITPVYTRLLTPDEYGQMSIFMTWVQVFGIVAMFCLSYGVFNNGMVDYPDKRNEFAFSMLVLSNLITVGFSAVLLAIYPRIRNVIGLDYPMVILMCTLFFFQPAYNFYIGKERYELRYKSVFAATVVTVTLSPLAAICCMLLCKNRLYGQVFGAQVSLIALYAGYYVYLARKSGGRVHTEFWKAALLFNLPIIPHYLSQYLLNHSDRLMIARLAGDSAAGFYSVAYAVAQVPLIGWNAISDALLPYTFEKCKNQDLEALPKLMFPVLAGFIGLCSVVILFAPEAVAMMATREYRQAIYVIPPIVGGIFFQAQYSVCSNVVYYYKKPQYMMIGSITATILNIVLNYICIPRFGYIAAGYTTLVSYMGQAALDYFFMNRVLHRQVYDVRILLLLSLLMLLIVGLSRLIYDCVWIRYAILAAILAVGFALRRRLAAFIRIRPGQS